MGTAEFTYNKSTLEYTNIAFQGELQTRSQNGVRGKKEEKVSRGRKVY